MTPIHALSPDPWLVAAVGLGAVTSAVVVALALVALARRRTTSYLLVSLAFGTLLARSAVALVAMNGLFSDVTHHTVEHGLDVVMAGLVLAAVYYARRVERSHAAGGAR